MWRHQFLGTILSEFLWQSHIQNRTRPVGKSLKWGSTVISTKRDFSSKYGIHQQSPRLAVKNGGLQYPVNSRNNQLEKAICCLHRALRSFWSSQLLRRFILFSKELWMKPRSKKDVTNKHNWHWNNQRAFWTPSPAVSTSALCLVARGKKDKVRVEKHKGDSLGLNLMDDLLLSDLPLQDVWRTGQSYMCCMEDHW